MKKAIYPLLFVTLVAFMATIAKASPVSPQQAKTVAATFLWKANTGIKHSNAPVDTAMLRLIYAAPQNNGAGTAYYVFAHAETGWVMVAGDNAVLPIIAYSYSGEYNTKEMPDNISAWLRHYVDEISDATARGTTPNAATTAQWEALMDGNAPTYEAAPTQAVPALMTTTWDQSPYYNNLCPYDNTDNTNAVTGCVATATAQIMKYWNHPATGYGSHSYVEDDYGTLSANFGTTSYNWTSMPNALTASSTATEVNAVATLMLHIGIADEMNYSTNESGAYNYSYNGSASTPSSQNALINHFKYAPNMQAVERSRYTDNEFCDILYSELAALRPILFSGSHETSGHSFVLDGCDLTGLFHINWGWGSFCDGYYAMGGLSPSSSGTGGNSYNSYNERNVALIGIRPNTAWGSSTNVSVLSATGGLATGGGTYSFGDTATIEAIANEGYLFSHWSAGGTLMPQSFVATGGSYSFTPVFEPLGGDTISYCGNGTLLSSLGGSSTAYWGMRIPASSLTNGHQLTAAQLYVRYAGTYTIVVYEGTSSPTTQIYTATMSFTDDDIGWNTFALATPHTIDATKSLWITFNNSDVSYPAAMATASGNSDGMLWGNNFQSIYSSWKYTFMIRAIMSDPTAIPMVTVSNIMTSTSGDGTCCVTFTTTPNAATTEYDVWCFNDNLYGQIENLMTQYDYDLSIIYLLTMGGEPIYPHFQGTTTNSWTQYNLMPNTGYHIVVAAKGSNDTTFSETAFLTPLVGGTGLATIACTIDSVTDTRAYMHTTMGDQTTFYYMFNATSEVCSVAYPNAQAVIDSGFYDVMSRNFNGYYNNLLPNTQYEIWLIPFNLDSVQGTPLHLSYTTTQGATRIVLVEQFTNQSVGWCSNANSQVEAALAGQENYIWISHHMNFWSDSLTNPASNALSWFFGPSGGFIPAMMYDRTNFSEENVQPVTSTGNVQNIQSTIAQARNVHCSLILNADNVAYNVDTRTVSGAIEGQFLQATSGNNMRITIYVVEDSIRMSQSVFSDGIGSVEPNYLHRNVVREAVTGYLGNPVSPASDGTFSYALNFTLNSNYNAAHTYLVAFVSNYDSTDINACGVYNATATGFLGPYVGDVSQPEVTVSVSSITDSSATVTFDVDDDSHPYYAYVDVNNDIYNYIASHPEYNTTEEEAFDALKNSSWLRNGDYTQNVSGLFPGTEYSIYTKVYASPSDTMGLFAKTTFTTRNSGDTAHVTIIATPDTNAVTAVFHPNNACTQYYYIASLNSLHFYLADNGFNSIEEMIRQQGTLQYGDDTVSYHRIRGGASVHFYTLALTGPNDFGNVDSAIVVTIPRGGTGTATMNITVSDITDTSAHVHYAAGNQTESFYIFYTTNQESSVDSMIALVSEQGWSPSYGNGGDWYPSHLTPNTTYYVWALPYNLNGVLGTYVRVPFTTLGTICYVTATCDTAQGYVTGGGECRTGDTILLQAFAHTGFRFTQWSDGMTDNPRTIVVTGNASYTALFEQATSAHVTIIATPDTNAVTAVFHPNNACTQYYFIASLNSLHFYLAGSGFNSIEEMIRQQGTLQYGDDTVSYHRIRGGASVHFYTLALTGPNDFGNVDSAIVVTIPRGGTGTATMNITVSDITDTSAHVHYAAGNQTESFYVFYTTNQESSVDSMIALVSEQGWSPSYGNGGDWYPSHLTPNTTYYVWALPYNLNGVLGTYVRVPFTTLGTICYVTATCDTAQGYVTGGGECRTGDTILLQAFAHTGFRFTQWSDGVTDNPRTIVVTGNASYTALFEQESYTINVSCDTLQGTVSGGGSGYYGDTMTLTATAFTGFQFAQWSDGVTDNPRTIVVTGNTSYVALFEQESYTINVSCDTSQGIVSGGGVYHAGDTLLLTATAKAGYRFKQWGDGDTNNPRTIVVFENASYTALFERNASINAVKMLYFSLNPNPASSFVTLSTNGNASDVQVDIFDMTGRRMMRTSLPTMQTALQINISSLPQGCYIVRVQSNGIESHKKLIVK